MNRYFLFGAYAVVSIVFFIYAWRMGSRQKRLEKKLDELKEQVREKR